MYYTWLGQAGLLLRKKGFTVIVDPYFSDSVQKVNPENYRRVAVDEGVFDLKPDVMIFTHNHLDHYDPETVKRFITPQSRLLVLAPRSVWNEVRKIGGQNNYVQLDRHTSWTENGVRFTAVKAVHSDPDAIGVLIDDGEKVCYITGDTLYSEEIFEDIKTDVHALFLPINGRGNNMNAADALRFAERVNPQKAVPIHIGMFDELTAAEFDFERAEIPAIYEEMTV